ncbi:hypothetical protein [Microcoleus sp. bin38.metabat.b11b12b14.051]|uniref:hypothetical protein n=1 Tax=Microcoleus sp. bin38.metabat.b11b12b14.051 TaxID=2742709 RepID=UPI0025E74A5A|nr:hypothetical protein [Microcoleus sp. bin38.metabat.b11b12b14.051]
MSSNDKNQPGGVKANETSSAASHYFDAAKDWLGKQGAKVSEWMANPSIDLGGVLGKYIDYLKSAVTKIGEIAQAISPQGIWDSISKAVGIGASKLKEKLKTGFLKPLIIVKDKIIGQLNNPEGQGLAIFGALSAAIIGGGVLLGAGPETVTGMLRISQLAYAFNFNQTDEQINRQIEGNISSLYSITGESFGSGLASFVSGGVFSFPRVQINMTKISILWRALNEEARTQLMTQLKGLSRTVFFTGLKMMMNLFYRDGRKMLKQLAKIEPNHPLMKLIPGGAETVQKWGGGGEPWSLALYVQKKIENTQSNPVTKNLGLFLEGFVEGFGEGLQDFLPDLVRQPIV